MKLVYSLLFWLFFSLSMLIEGASVLAHCPDESKQSDLCTSGSTWQKGNRIVLRTHDARQDYQGIWTFAIAENHDILLLVDQQSGQEKQQGKIMLVSGRAMLIHGLDLKPGFEIDAMDGPVLMLQLALRLLEQAFPAGAEAITTTHQINVTETAKGLKVATSSAKGHFAAPWTLEGAATRKSEAGIDFDVVFTFKTGQDNQTDSQLNISGSWAKLLEAPSFPDDLPLGEWKIYFLGPLKGEDEGKTSVEYGASPKAVKVETLGQLRSLIAQEKKKP